MNLTYSRLKKLIPHLNERVVSPEDLLKLFAGLKIEYEEIALKRRGYCVCDADASDVFLRNGLSGLLYHEVLAHEGVHAILHHPIKSLLGRHELQAEALALICLMPLKSLRRLYHDAHGLDPDEYELLKRRLRVLERWSI